MSTAVQPDTPVRSIALARPPAWRWVHVAVAALAMVATLPGRTLGLGLVTEPLLRDLDLDRVGYASINLWATLLGAAFCVPCGWLIDRLGVRVGLTAILASLGAVVVVMSRVQGDWAATLPLVGAIGALDLFLLVLLTRGLGQSALSVGSLALMGQAAGRRPGLAVAVYSILVAVGFGLALGAIKVLDCDWRSLWAGIGYGVLACALVSALLIRPGVSGWTDGSARAGEQIGVIGMTLMQAMATPGFWVFALATSFYGMMQSGIALFNESVLRERGLNRDDFLAITQWMPLVGLVSNLATGFIARQAPSTLGRLLAMAMLLLGGAMAAFPLVTTLWQAYVYAAVMALAGGMVTVLFFAFWGQAYGPLHLGKIQGAAQMLTVLASAVGPLLLAQSVERTGSYVPLFQLAAGAAAVLAVAAWLTPLPRPEEVSHA
jgi:MFS family permease